jgi:DNA-binding PucR family transcriptional regulator
VHENTVRYRLRKMSEVTVLDLTDVRKRLAMTVELAATDDDMTTLFGDDKFR